MTGTQKTEPRPIDNWENRKTRGLGMAHKPIFEDHLAEISKLRERQEAYEASLPKDPVEALIEIGNCLRETDDLNDEVFAPRAALEILRQLAIHEALDDSEQLNSAVCWLTALGLDGFSALEQSIRRASNIAHQFHPHHTVYKA